MNILLLTLATLPGLLLSYAIFRADKYEREPLAPLLLCFALGAAVTFPALEIEKWAFNRLRPYEEGFGVIILTAFIAVALNEEVFKYAVLRCFAFPRQFFNEPLDGIVYSVMIAMGFATMENISFASRFGLETVLLRSFTAVPAHLVVGEQPHLGEVAAMTACRCVGVDGAAERGDDVGEDLARVAACPDGEPRRRFVLDDPARVPDRPSGLVHRARVSHARPPVRSGPAWRRPPARSEGATGGLGRPR